MHLAPVIALLAAIGTVAANSHNQLKRTKHLHGKKAAKAAAHAPREDPDAVADLTPQNITRRDTTYTGIGTFFYVGLGACGLESQDSDMMVALNSDQYGSGYPGPECFKYITVEGNGVTVSGIEILDECPTCAYGSLDMSPGLFQKYADEDAGTVTITWWYEDGSASTTSSSSTSTYQYTPTTTSTYQYTPTTTSTWVAPSSTSTYVPPSSTSTWIAPSSTSTSTWVAPSSSTSTYVPPSSSTSLSSSSWSSSASASYSSASVNSTSSYASVNTTNPYAIISNTNTTSSVVSSDTNSTATTTNSTGTSASSGSSSTSASTAQNLADLNSLVANYGQMIVAAASN